MNATIEVQAETVEINSSEQTLRSLLDVELVLVGGGEFVALGG
jgi:hypothetical protein